MARLTTVTATGALHVVRKPRVNCTGTDVDGGSGLLKLRIVKVGGPDLVEFDNVTFDVEGSSGRYAECDSKLVLSQIPLVVKSSDRAEKDACPVHAEGVLHLVDASAKHGGDVLVLKVPACHLDLTLTKARASKSDHLAVALAFDAKGY